MSKTKRNISTTNLNLLIQIYVKQEKKVETKTKKSNPRQPCTVIPRRRLNVALTTTSWQERDIHVNYLSVDF